MDTHIYLERQFGLIFILTFMKLSLSFSWVFIFTSIYLRLLMPLIHSFIILEDRMGIRKEQEIRKYTSYVHYSHW